MPQIDRPDCHERLLLPEWGTGTGQHRVGPLEDWVKLNGLSAGQLGKAATGGACSDGSDGHCVASPPMHTSPSPALYASQSESTPAKQPPPRPVSVWKEQVASWAIIDEVWSEKRAVALCTVRSTRPPLRTDTATEVPHD